MEPKAAYASYLIDNEGVAGGGWAADAHDVVFH